MNTVVRGLAAIGRRLLMPLGLCLLCTFSAPCGLDIDGHGNMGDETMTVALSSDASLKSLSAYGYRPDGQAWTWGVNTAPLYSVVYGPVVNAASPLRRLEVARLVSRVLGGVSIFLLAVAMVQLVWRKPIVQLSLKIQLLVLAFIAFVFINSPRFRFIASFARVDMLGFLFLAAVLAAGSWMLLAAGPVTVFVFTFVALSTAWTSYVAFYLVAFVAAAVLLAAAAEAANRPSFWRAVGSLAGNVVLPASGAVVAFVVISSWLGGALLSGPAAGGMAALADRIRWFATSPDQIKALARSDRWLFLAAGICGLVIAFAWSMLLRWLGETRERSIGHLWTLAALGVWLAVLAVVYRLWMVTLGSLPIRFTYDVMITTAFGFLQLIVCCYIARNWRGARYIMGGAIAVALLYVTIHPWEPTPMAWLRCHDDNPLTEWKLWPVKPLPAVYNPFDDSHESGNRARQLHVAAVRGFLLEHGAENVLATDPMFAVLSDRRVKFFFLNDSGSPKPSPAAEEAMMASIVLPKKIQYVVSNEFGEAEELDRAGFAALRSCLRHAAAGGAITCEFGKSTVQLARVFRTDEAVRTPGAYSYTLESSTPLTIYKMTIIPSR